MRRYIIFGFYAAALLLILQPLYKPNPEEKPTAATTKQPQQFLASNQEIATSPPVTKVSTKPEAKIWSRLRQGKGNVILMRHALAPGIGDPPDFKLNDCSTQRNLSAEGRKQAIATGKAFRSNKIRVSRVLSSQWCRCLETAKLLNLGKVERFATINSFFHDDRTQPQQTAQLRQFIINNRNKPGVVVMVTHEVNITRITGNMYPKSGESVVVRANGNKEIEVVGQIEPY
jgi:phosphohistidine phosphatase SixA